MQSVNQGDQKTAAACGRRIVLVIQVDGIIAAALFALTAVGTAIAMVEQAKFIFRFFDHLQRARGAIPHTQAAAHTMLLPHAHASAKTLRKKSGLLRVFDGLSAGKERREDIGKKVEELADFHGILIPSAPERDYG